MQCVFEYLPVQAQGTFGAAVAGFSLRDSQDLETALTEIRRAIRPGGRFAFCDLGQARLQGEGGAGRGHTSGSRPLSSAS